MKNASNMKNLAALLAITDQFLSDNRDRMAQQRTLIAGLQEKGQCATAARKLLAVFEDIEGRLLAYRGSLEDELAKQAGT